MDFLRDIFDFILPPYCSICKKRLYSGEKSICKECWGSIDVIVSSFCKRCGGASKAGVCNDCIEHPHEFTRARALGEYKGVLKELILLGKGQRPKVSIWRRLGRMLVMVLKNDGVINRADALIAVPLYPVTRRARGYNQSEILAHEVSSYTGIPELKNVLFQVKYTKPQKSFDTREERELNVKDAFRGKRAEGVKGRKILLIDDVFTTGATLDECAKELYKVGADEIYALVVARA